MGEGQANGCAGAVGSRYRKVQLPRVFTGRTIFPPWSLTLPLNDEPRGAHIHPRPPRLRAAAGCAT